MLPVFKTVPIHSSAGSINPPIAGIPNHLNENVKPLLEQWFADAELIPYDPNWAMGGYVHNATRLLPLGWGQKRAAMDPTGRQILLLGCGENGALVFVQRHSSNPNRWMFHLPKVTRAFEDDIGAVGVVTVDFIHRLQSLYGRCLNQDPTALQLYFQHPY